MGRGRSYPDMLIKHKIHVIQFRIIGFKGCLIFLIQTKRLNMEVWLITCYSLLRRHLAEKRFVVERAEAEYCEASFCWIK